jgi:hypothetical protein
MLPENQKNSCDTKSKWLINEAGEKSTHKTIIGYNKDSQLYQYKNSELYPSSDNS